jgi:class 3 adenylate cyclase
MLFADVKNFSMIREELAPEFFSTFIDRVSSVVYGLPVKSVFRNTWGDGLFMVFKDVLDCAELAVKLLETIEAVAWEKLGLPKDTTIRIGVHYGPVYRQMDKIIRRYNYFGSHVNRAARIEPVTTPGCIFTSEQFAAELALLGEHDYVTEYVGVEELAKEFDRCTLYQLARRQ